MSRGDTAKPAVDPRTIVGDVRLVINKVTQYCNLDCSYCSAKAVKPDGSIEHISDAVFERAAELFVGNTRQPTIEWLFHGGEPLLLPAEWFRARFEFLERVARKNPHVERLLFGVQSNAVALKRSHIDLFAEKDVCVSASLDGTPEINDIQRGRGEVALRNIGRLARAGIGGGVISVITPHNVDHIDEMLDCFERRGANGIKLNNMVCVGRGHDQSGISAEQYARVLFRYLQRIAERGRVQLINNDLLVTLERYFGRGGRVADSQDCYSYHCAAGKYFFGVESDGRVFPCGRGADTKALELFNVLQDRIDGEAYRRALGTLHEKDVWFVRCFGCQARRICAFGCPAFERGNLGERELQCASTKALYKLMEDRPGVVRRAWQAFRRLPQADTVHRDQGGVWVGDSAATQVK